MCLDVLSYCATSSTEAQALVETVKTFQRLLDDKVPSTFSLPKEKLPPGLGVPLFPSDQTSSSWRTTSLATSSTNQSAGSGLESEGMNGFDLSRPDTITSQSSGEGALPLDSSSSTEYSLSNPWSDMSRLLYSTNLDNSLVDQSGQPPIVPQLFQNFLQWIPNYQDSQEFHQDQNTTFSTGESRSII